MGILLFVYKYMYISLLLKMINGFSWPAKLMASPFNITITEVNSSVLKCIILVGLDTNLVEHLTWQLL